MISVVKKKIIEDSLKKAKELELHEPLPSEQVVGIYKESMASLEKFKKMLGKEWFVRDVHKKKRKGKKKAGKIRRQK